MYVGKPALQGQALGVAWPRFDKPQGRTSGDDDNELEMFSCVLESEARWNSRRGGKIRPIGRSC